MKIVFALLVFSIIIIIHELGHFLLAKKNGIGVTEFSVGMGPRLLSTEKKGTKYSLKLLPFGGSCQMVGEDEVNDEEGSFNSKSVGARISVIAAGPVFNFILAFIFAWIIISLVGFDQPEVLKVQEGSPASTAGIQGGDRILRINNKKINIYKEIDVYLQFHPGETIDITYEREGETYKSTIEPVVDENGYYDVGFLGGGLRTKGNPLQSIKYGVYEVKYWISTTFQSLKMLVTGNVKADDVSGPVGIVNIIGDTYETSKTDGAFYVFLNMLNISILLSANLGVMNLLPLPALDGGRLVFLIIEGIRGKRISPEKEGMVHFTGLVLLMILMVFIMFNDIRNLF